LVRKNITRGKKGEKMMETQERKRQNVTEGVVRDGFWVTKKIVQ